jgi:hypothetical protein
MLTTLQVLATSALSLGAALGAVRGEPTPVAGIAAPHHERAGPSLLAEPAVPGRMPPSPGETRDEAGARRARIEHALRALGRRVHRQSAPDALRTALRAYYNYRSANPRKVRKPYLYYVDYGLDAKTPRGYVFDMDALRVVEGPFHVAHGRGSAATGRGIPTLFSDRNGSNSTTLGLFLAQETYLFSGKYGGRRYRAPGLRLTGLSGRFNRAARARGVVVHGAPYVTARRAGRSEGCPAMELARARRLIPRIAGGGLVFHFSPRDRRWRREDPWVNRI